MQVSLRSHTVGIVAVTFLALSLVIYVAARVFITGSANNVELLAAERMGDRIVVQLARESDRLITVAREWVDRGSVYESSAMWDSEFLSGHLANETFRGLDIHMMMFVDEPGNLIYGRAYDRERQLLLEIPDALVRALKPESPLLTFAPGSDAVVCTTNLNGRPWQFASVPMTAGTDGSPSRGAIIVGRYLDVKDLVRLATGPEGSARLIWSDDGSLTPDDRSVLDDLAAGAPSVVRVIGRESAGSYIALRDAENKLVGALGVERPQFIASRGRVILVYFMGWFLAAGLIVAVILTWALRRTIVDRVTNLRQKVEAIREGGDLSVRLPETGSDEITELTAEVNALFERLASSLEREILSATSTQQLRVAQDLHDNLGQLLTAVSLEVQTLASGETGNAERVARIQSLLREAVQQTREVATGLAPVEIRAGGIRYALSTLENQTADTFHTRCETRFAGEIPELDEETASHLYYIAKESVTNAVRHGEAQRVSVELAAENGSLKLSVEDDGKGFEPTSGMDRLGLRLMRLRADMIGATLRIGPGLRAGTRVECQIRKVGRRGAPVAALAVS